MCSTDEAWLIERFNGATPLEAGSLPALSPSSKGLADYLKTTFFADVQTLVSFKFELLSTANFISLLITVETISEITGLIGEWSLVSAICKPFNFTFFPPV